MSSKMGSGVLRTADFPQPSKMEGLGSPCTIKVVGIGGGGGNAVDRMIETSIVGVDFWALNTDVQALSKSLAKPQILTIGTQVTKGLGAGGDPDMGRKAAEESSNAIRQVVEGADMVFVTAGMGGGTGSGAAPLVAEIAKSAGALTVAVVTKPFGFEGKRRAMQAASAISQLQAAVDTLIVVSNDKLLEIVPEDTPVQDAFLVADDILRQGVIGISEIIIKPGLVNVDFADVRAIMQNAGSGIMGVGIGKGKNRATDAAKAATSSPLLDAPLTKATGVVFNIIGDKDLTLTEINEAAEVIYQCVDPEANIIFGALVDETMAEGTMSITVLATGIGGAAGKGSGRSTQRRASMAAQQGLEEPDDKERRPTKPTSVRQIIGKDQEAELPSSVLFKKTKVQKFQNVQRKSKRKMLLNFIKRLLGLGDSELEEE